MTDDQQPVWVTPEQVEAMRDACYDERFQSYTRQRNDALIALLADTGLRVGETVQLRTDDLTDDYERLILQPDVQKTYQENNPGIVRMELGKLVGDLPRTLRSYLDNRDSDADVLFPSRTDREMSTQAVRNILKKVAVVAEIEPYNIDNTRAEATDMHPHALRHSVAYRMLEVEDGFSLEDVQRRLRHGRRETTEDTYSHFLTV